MKNEIKKIVRQREKPLYHIFFPKEKTKTGNGGKETLSNDDI